MDTRLIPSFVLPLFLHIISAQETRESLETGLNDFGGECKQQSIIFSLKKKLAFTRSKNRSSQRYCLSFKVKPNLSLYVEKQVT